MSAVDEFFHMGGYGAFVWSAYGVAAVVMVLMFAASWRAARSSERMFSLLQQQSPRRRKGTRVGNATETASGSGQ